MWKYITGNRAEDRTGAKSMGGRFMPKIVCCAVMAVVLAAGVCNAEKIDDCGEISHWEYTYFQSMITYVSPLKDYIVTTDRKVRLVEADCGGDSLTTSIKDIHGDDIGVDELRAGRWVYVWGGVLGDHSIGARDIVLLGGKLTGQDWPDYPALQERKKFIYGHGFY